MKQMGKEEVSMTFAEPLNPFSAHLKDPSQGNLVFPLQEISQQLSKQ